MNDVQDNSETKEAPAASKILIANFGLFWHRSQVYWGRQKSAGHLMGIVSSAKKSDPVDFREQRGIYVLYDDLFEPVYVGQAGKGARALFPRLRDHTADHLADRWTRFSWFGIRAVDEKTNKLRSDLRDIQPPLPNILDHFEAIVISAVEPRLNRRGGNFGSETDQYIQYSDNEKLGPSVEDRIAAIEKLLKNKGEGAK